MIYSNSSINSFETCPYRFKLMYVDRIKPVRKSIEAFMGSRVHEALEKLYRDKIYEKTCSLEELLEFYNNRWEKEMNEQIFVAKEYDINNYRKMGERYLIDYYNTYKPFDEGKIIALEKRIVFPINENYWIAGVIDRVMELDGKYEVHDYKTSIHLPTKQEMENDPQLAIYALSLKYFYDIEDVELVWHFLAFNKEIRIRKSNYEDARKNLIDKINKIERAIKENEFPTSESSLCNYCEYQQICPIFRHKWYEDEDSYSLVNKYWEICSKISEMKEIQRQIRERLIEYAEKNGLERLYGSGKFVDIKKYKNISFKEQNKLKEILKECNLYENYSKIDLISLSNDYISRNLPEIIYEKIKLLAEEKKDVRVYLREIDE
ncbi:MAG: PD-(D/E)XK nuclease family protein [Thermoplasmatales archaeon]|nr:PD-(D/E)XK nuclease family protein [Thermoplasmatales archaeon]